MFKIIMEIVLIASIGYGGIRTPFDPMGTMGGNWWDGLNMTAVWPLDEGYGSTVFAKVGSVNGTIGSCSWQNSEGMNYLLFPDANNGWVNLGDNYDLGTNGILLSAWVWEQRFPTFPTPMGIINKTQTSDPNTRYYLGFTSENPGTLYSGYGSSVRAVETSPSVALSNWTHVASAITRSKISIFVNGEMTIETNVTPSSASYNTTTPLYIGTDGYNTVRRFSGRIRDVGIKFNGTTNDIVRIYNASKSRYRK